MKTIFTLFCVLCLSLSYGQDTIKQIDTVQKVIVINPLPVTEYNTLKNKGTAIEVTMYASSKTFSLPKNSGVNYFLSMIEGKATTEFNTTNSGYIMILVNEDFYMDAEVSLSDKNNYLIFKKDGIKYYNLLNDKGIAFFSKFL